jgi:hypothetical protein
LSPVGAVALPFTGGGAAEMPPLTVWLGPLEPPVSPAPLPDAPPVGEGAVPAGSWLSRPGDPDVVGGGTADGVVAGIVLTEVPVSLGCSVSSLLQPTRKPAAAIAATPETNIEWWSFFMRWR